MAAELVGKPYAFIIDKPHRWSSWAAPKKVTARSIMIPH
jgi:type I restriction enzyme M protein